MVATAALQRLLDHLPVLPVAVYEANQLEILLQSPLALEEIGLEVVHVVVLDLLVRAA